MAIFAVHAYEGTYGGLHGIENYFITECNTEEEAQDEGYQASYELFDSYSSTFEYYTEDMDEDEQEDWKEENACCSVYELRADCPYDFSTLDEMVSNDFKTLINDWAIKK